MLLQQMHHEQNNKYYQRQKYERVVSILATIDGVEYYVPMNTGNMHYEAIQEWVSAGNTIEEAE